MSMTRRAFVGALGLSALAAHEGSLYVVERDNRIGDAARIKKLFRVMVSELEPAAIGDEQAAAGDLEAAARCGWAGVDVVAAVLDVNRLRP